MDGANTEIDENAYLSGAALGDAIFEFGSPELIEAYNKPIQIKPLKDPAGFVEIIQGYFLAKGEIQNTNLERQNIIQALKNEIKGQIRKGDLIPFGFKEPRNIEDKPIKIPADLLLSGELNWDNSELKYRTAEFTGIRLLGDLMPPIEIKPENSEIVEISEPIKKKKNSKNTKLDFAELPDDRHLNEKQVADYLGLSVKTLQGYRVKGGGPEFFKFGPKMVRYRLDDIKKWAENRKKKNTSY